MEAVLIAFHHLGRITKYGVGVKAVIFLSHFLWVTRRWSQASTNSQAPSARGPSHASSTLYSWTIPFWLSSGGGCQVTTIAVPFPSFLVTETLWGGALGAVCSEKKKIEWLCLSQWKMVSGLYRCNLLCPTLHWGQIKWCRRKMYNPTTRFCCSFAVQARKNNTPNCTPTYALPACHSSGHWVPHWSQIFSPRIKSFEK